jgi:hypothetical protein
MVGVGVHDRTLVVKSAAGRGRPEGLVFAGDADGRGRMISEFPPPAPGARGRGGSSSPTRPSPRATASTTRSRTPDSSGAGELDAAEKLALFGDFALWLGARLRAGCLGDERPAGKAARRTRAAA